MKKGTKKPKPKGGKGKGTGTGSKPFGYSTGK